MPDKSEMPDMAHIPSKWKSLAKKHGILGKSIHGLTGARSGSNIKPPQFLLLRALYPEELVDASHFLDFNAKRKFISPGYIEGHYSAKDFISKKLQFFDAYLAAIPNREKHPSPELGTFDLVRHFQLASETNRDDKDLVAVSKLDLSPKKTRYNARAQAQAAADPVTPTKSTGTRMDDLLSGMDEIAGNAQSLPNIRDLRLDNPFSPVSPLGGVTGQYMTAVEDEQIVNTALISLLAAITIHDKKVKGEWSLSRQAFHVSKERNPLAEEKVYEARVDGVLRDRDSKEVKAIVEVKPFLRHRQHKIEAIRMQETAQMAAWICSHPPDNLDELREKKTKTSRLLVSQDRHEIYLTFATFDADYVDYITGGNSSAAANPFLTMQEVGPYVTDRVEHMKSLAIVISAFAKQECS